MPENLRDYENYMKMALRLAKKAAGNVGHYPMVGALVIKNGKVVGKGYFKKPGRPHAEVLAIKDAKNQAKGSTLVLNLEPCSHYGRTPPCADFVIAAGIKKVVAGMQDPNPKVSGRGFKKLRAAGIELLTGVMETECRKLNEVFIKHVTTGRPFVTLKAAITLDGAIATTSGHSKWITSEASRKIVHRMRDRADAVMVGAKTVLNDDPRLTVRLAGKARHPRPVIIDTRLSLPLESKVIQTPAPGGLIIVCTNQAPKKKIETLRKTGAQVWIIGKNHENMVDLHELMERLGEINLAHVLLEGGSRLFSSALRAGIVDKVVLFIAPRIVTGDAIRMTSGPGPDKINQALDIKDITVRKTGPDLMVTGYPTRN